MKTGGGEPPPAPTSAVIPARPTALSFSISEEGGGSVPSGRGDIKDKKNKKKSKEQLEREMKKKSFSTAPVESMTFEVIKPKRKERDF
jgi:hypothetical protein